MLAVAEAEKKNARDVRYARLFPSEEELDKRLVMAMRVPKSECLTKEQLLKRLSKV